MPSTTLAEIRSGQRFQDTIVKAFGWPFMDGRGFDFECGRGLRAEARSRFLGTDREFPRITVSRLKLETSHVLVCGHYDPESLELVRAIVVPMMDIRALFDRYLHKGNKAHIPFKLLAALPRAINVTARLRLH